MPIRRLLPALALLLFCLGVCAEARAQADERERAVAEVESLREQIRQKESLLLSVPAEDRERHAEFLAQPDTGLVRLLPREKWQSVLPTRGGGSFYSFTRLSHEYGSGSDVVLEQGALRVGFMGADFGFMLNLGDVPLETVSAEAEAVRFMASFETPSPEPSAREAQRRFMGSGGAQSGQWTYKNRLPAVAGNTYALRSVSYNTSDVLVAFRVLRKETDGSVVLLWKVLKKYPKPSLEMGVRAAAGS